MDDDHYLDSYLSDILPALGLDFEAYAPYVTSFMKEGSDDDVDSLEELIDLLRASSESHGEDDSAWEKFRKEITHRRLDYRKGVDLRKEMEALDIQAATRANLQKEVEISQKNAHELEARKRMELESEKLENMSATKIALMAKYGYEDDTDDDIEGEDEDAEAPKTNREYAAAMSLQKAQKQKSVKVQSKQEARQETAKAKNDKLAKKEERRKKAEKRERQR